MAIAMEAKKGRRQLRRNTTNPTIPVEVQMQKCIKGCKRKRWMVLNTLVFMERECVGIKSTQPWLHMMLAGTLHRSTFHNAISNFVHDCREALQKQAAGLSPAPLAAASGQAPAPPLQDCGASRDNAAKIGRAAIIQQDDPDDDDLVRPIAHRKRTCTKGWVTVSVRNMNIECCNGRGLQFLVPVDGQSLDLILQHLFQRAGEPLQCQRSQGVPRFAELLTESDCGKIMWRQQASSQSVGFWQITYRKQTGIVGRARQGMAVPRTSLTGSLYSASELMEAAQMVLQKARVQWNRLDCSAAERFPEFT